MMHLYTVNGSGYIEGRTYIQGKTLNIIATSLMDAAKEFERLNPSLQVWNIAHKGKIDMVTAAAYASLLPKVVCDE